MSFKGALGFGMAQEISLSGWIFGGPGEISAPAEAINVPGTGEISLTGPANFLYKPHIPPIPRIFPQSA